LNWFRKKGKLNSPVSTPTGFSGNNSPGAVLPAGSQAPEFSLESTQGKEISLADLRGKPVILAFYPADWSPVCGDQLALYNEVLPLFEEHNAQLLGISVDNHWSHQAYAKDRNLSFPLLADFEPKGEIARKYGVYDPQAGLCQRALFVIDSQGIIRWSYVSPSSVNPGANGILSALESLEP
jgi:peroxiredoxin